MAVRIGSNSYSMAAQRGVSAAADARTVSMERLSSGMRVNRASDDPAGLAVAASLNFSRRISNQGLRNLSDGISLLTVAEGALNELSKISTRHLELAEQAANGAYSRTQRKAISAEAIALVDEYNRIVQSTSFNGVRVLDGSLATNPLTFQGGIGEQDIFTVSLGAAMTRPAGDGAFQTAGVSTVGVASLGDVETASDVNGDGNIDLLVAHYSGTSLGVLLGNGDGTFKAETSYTTGSGPLRLETADLNKDGRLDVVVTDYQAAAGSTVSVLLGNGDGTFKTRASYAVSVPAEAAIGDANGDGIPDLIVTERNTSRVAVLLGNGDGSFTEKTTFAVGTTPHNVIFTDVDGDAIGDLVVANRSSSNYSVLLGNGDGSFRAQRSYAGGSDMRGIAALDLNKDGALDLISTDVQNGVGTTVSVLLGNSDGSFRTRRSYFVGVNPAGATLMDYNEDGRIDLNVRMNAGYSVLLSGNGDGTFSQAVTLQDAPSGSIVAYSDLNRDGARDYLRASGATLTALIANTKRTTTILHLDLESQASAAASLNVIRSTQDTIMSEIGRIGAARSRLDAAVRNLVVQRENVAAAASRITDADIAGETADMVKNQIRQQAAAAVFAQANQTPALALRLLGDR